MDLTYLETVKAFVESQRDTLDSLVRAGKVRPIIFPRDFVSFPIVYLALLIRWPRQGPIKYIKHLLYFYSLYSNIYVILHCRSLLILGGYWIGLIFAWLSIWSAALLLFSDVQGNFKRIERTFEPFQAWKRNLPTEKKRIADSEAPKLRRLKGPKAETGKSPGDEAIDRNVRVVSRFKWQGYPDTLRHRLTWVLDVCFNHRGPHWNWRPSDFPALPKEVQLQLTSDENFELNENMLWEEDIFAHLRSAFYWTLVFYLCLDGLIIISMKDRYFLGYIDCPPPRFLVVCGISAPLISRAYRFLFNTLAVYLAIVFPISAITTVSLALSLTRLRFMTRIPLEASFLYPDYFQNILTSTLDGGLIGLWGTCWHKHFRAGFLAPGNWIRAVYTKSSGGTQSISPSAFWGLQVLLSFTLSGVLHSAGSYTQIASTNPSWQFLFFMSQMTGILIQAILEKLFNRILPFTIPPWLKKGSKITFTIAWILCFGPLLGDDFVLGRVWLHEPIPYSPLRALGFGVTGDTALRWEVPQLKWWQGEKWWEHGIIL